MKTINFRFLHYKKYDKFKQDLTTSDKIKEGDIVFIQDALRIWARGKEYVCDGPSSTNVESDTLTFKNGTDNTVMTIRSADGTITFTDSTGKTLSTTFALNSNFAEEIRRLDNLIQNNWDNLAKVAKTGNYNDLINKPNPVIIDEALSDSSENPVQNKVIYGALNSKADSSEFSLYVKKNVYEQAIAGKQDKLTAESPVYIRNNKIGVYIDNELYVIVTNLQDVENPNSNKIYLLEIPNGDGTFRYEQYRWKNGQWFSIGNAMPNIDLAPYLKSADAEDLYQHKGNYADAGDLFLYTLKSDFTELQSSLINYVTYTYADKNYQPKRDDYAIESWVIQNFVKKADVYTPNNYNGSNESFEGSIVINPTNQSGSSNITVDKKLDENSSNPVENRVVTTALNLKANKSSLKDYATKEELKTKADASSLDNYITVQQHTQDLSLKQDILTPAPNGGISIVNNQISCTIDTNAIIITDDLESVTTPDPNKIYLLENVVNGKTIYIEYRWKNNGWVEIGVRSPEINLSDYYKKYEVNNLYNNITENYLLKTDASYLYQPKRSDYVITSDLAQYTPLSRTKDIEDLLDTFVTYSDLISRNLASIDWIESTFVKKSDVYTPKNQEESSSGGTEGEGSGTVVVDPTVVNITVDDHLSLVSTNPVANWVIKAALDLKADKSDLNNKADKSDLLLKANSSDLQLKADKSELLDYASKADLNSKADASQLSNYVLNSQHQIDLASKQDVLTAGRGISIQNNQISSTLDTTVYLIVDTLPSEGDENKIYLLESEDNGDIIYTEYRWYDNDWHEIGQRTPEIDLSGYLTTSDASLTYQQKGDYLTKAEASSTYQEKGNYLTKSEALSTYQPIIDDYATSEDIDNLDQKFNDYVTTTTLNALRIYLENRYQGKGEYALKDEITAALNTLQQVIDQKYVLKRDVYRPNNSEWSSESPTSISIDGSSGGSSGGSGSISNMVTLTTLEYQHLVDNNLVDLNTYYFTYEDEEETTTNWTFGGTFPVILGGSGLGEFPITLT